MAIVLFHSYVILVSISLIKFKKALWDYLKTNSDSQAGDSVAQGDFATVWVA